MGMLYKRGNVWWLKYYRNGKPFFESSKSSKKMVAKKLLERREGEIAQGKMPGSYFDKVTFKELAQGLILDYEDNNRKSTERVKIGVAHLARFFGEMKATEINTPAIQSYKKLRKTAGASNATVNRELAALKRMFNLAARATPPRVAHVPYIPMNKERNVRKGFFEHDEYLAVREAILEYMKPVVTFAYKTGWRKNEILGLEWAQVDLKQGVARLEPGDPKNEEGRTVFLDNEIKAVLKEQFRNRQLGCPYVFHKNGRRITYIKNVWQSACKKAGLDGKLFHDLRRTAVRNMVRAGIPESVAMTISGHKTRSVFDRYNIVNLEDLRQAALKLEAYHKN